MFSPALYFHTSPVPISSLPPVVKRAYAFWLKDFLILWLSSCVWEWVVEEGTEKAESKVIFTIMISYLFHMTILLHKERKNINRIATWRYYFLSKRDTLVLWSSLFLTKLRYLRFFNISELWRTDPVYGFQLNWKKTQLNFQLNLSH